MPQTIRVDEEVYYHTLKAQSLLQIATGQIVRPGEAIMFLLSWKEGG